MDKFQKANTYLASYNPAFAEYIDGLKQGICEAAAQTVSPLADLLDGAAHTVELYHGEQIADTRNITNVRELSESLKILGLVSRKIALAEQDGIFEDDSIGDRKVSRFVSADGDVAVTARAHSDEDGEARLCWTIAVSPDEQKGIFGKVVVHDAKGRPKASMVSIRLDKEDATGKIALDIGGTQIANRMLNHNMAIVVSGNAQHANKRRGRDSGGVDYHVREPFENIDPATFSKFVEAKKHHYEVMSNRRTKNALPTLQR